MNINDKYTFNYTKYKIHFPYPYSSYRLEAFNLYDKYTFNYTKYKIHFPYPYSSYRLEAFNLYESYIYIYFKDIDLVIIYDTYNDLVDVGGKYEDSYHWYKPSKVEKEEIGKIYHREIYKKLKLMFKKLSDDI